MYRKVLSHFKRKDPILYSVAQEIKPFTLKKSKDHFYALCDSIISQQLSNKASATIFNRFIKLFPQQKPSAVFLMKLKDEKIRKAGISYSKILYLKNLAQRIIDKKIDFDSFEKDSDQTVIEKLTQVKGIGKWTAEMFLISSLGRPDVFSTGDLGLRREIQKLYNIKTKPSLEELEKISEKWSPYRTYACFILWRNSQT